MEQSPSRTTAEGTTAVRHPLDPLTAGEFRRAVTILRHERNTDERWRFASIELKEPLKGTRRTSPWTSGTRPTTRCARTRGS